MHTHVIQKLRELLEQKPHTSKELVIKSGHHPNEVSSALFDLGNS